MPASALGNNVTFDTRSHVSTIDLGKDDGIKYTKYEVQEAVQYILKKKRKMLANSLKRKLSGTCSSCVPYLNNT